MFCSLLEIDVWNWWKLDATLRNNEFKRDARIIDSASIFPIYGVLQNFIKTYQNYVKKMSQFLFFADFCKKSHNERNNHRIETHLTALKNSFWRQWNNQKRIASLFKYKFARLGDYIGALKPMR